jgi:DNA-binding transcriptional ArsR family regulator
VGKVFQPDDGRFSSQLSEVFGSGLRDAIGHATRRDVLRALHRKERPCGLDEIALELPAFGIGRLSYHLQVLRQAGVVTETLGHQGPARYRSVVSEDGQVRAVLRATARWDGARREAAAFASPNPLLTMFRIPRPVRTIRLRSRRKTDEDGER